MNRQKSLGVMVDCSRCAVYTVETLKTYFDYLAKMGYNAVQLYTEDVYEIEDEPFFGYLRGKYSHEELKELDSYAKSKGLELIPCIQTLAHLGCVTRWPEYFNTCVDTGDILLAGDERTYQLIERMFAACAECFTSRRINIGMDEAHMVGLGKYLDLHGYQNRFDILLAHLKRVSDIAEKYGFRLMMWSDMFFRLLNNGGYYCENSEMPQDVLEMIPENIELIYWDYYNTEKEHYDQMIRAHKQFRNKIVFAGGSWSWSGFVPSNKFSIEAWRAAIRSCEENQIDDITVTCWKDDGAECSLFASLPTLLYAAEFFNGNFDEEKIARKFYRLTGVELNVFLNLEKLNFGEEIGIQNPSKYMLYSDPFLGFLDQTAHGITGKEFAPIKAGFIKGTKSRRFGYIFKTIASLCDVLEIKYILGLRTRDAYKKNDKNELISLIEDYKETENRLEKFYLNFRNQWDKESKLNGFEVHDIRIGGLIRRIKHCREVLADYVAGKINRIPSLEEEIIPYNGNEPGKTFNYNNWHKEAMIKSNM